MSQLNLLVPQSKRLQYLKEAKKIKLLAIVVLFWLAYLVFSLITIELNWQKNRQLQSEISTLSKKSSNQYLTNQINLTKQKLAQIRTINQDNQTKKIIIEQISQIISNQAEIKSIAIETLQNKKVKLSIKLKLKENQNSSKFIENLKKNYLFNQVVIDSSNSANGIKQINLTILVEVIKKNKKR